MIAAILGGYITQYYHPKWGFMIFSICGLMILFWALILKEDKVKSNHNLGGSHTFKEAIT